jgi:hypothetical protein
VLAALCRCTLSWRGTTPDVTIPHLLFWIALHHSFSVLQYNFDGIVDPCCMNSTISNPFLSQKTVPISFLAGWQCLFKHFWLVWWMCVHPLLWLLFGFNIHKWNPGFITCYSYDIIEKFITTFAVLLKKVKAEAILCVLCVPMSIFRTHVALNLWQRGQTVTVS